MVKRCYYKPNRSESRNFTESDAARVLCYAIRDGADLESFFEKAKVCGKEQIELFIENEVKKAIKPTLCRISVAVDKALKIPLRRLVAIVLLVRTAVDSLDGLVSDIEDFNIVGFRVPRALTRPIRRVVDSLVSLVDDVEASIDSIFTELEILKEYCDGSENQDE